MAHLVELDPGDVLVLRRSDPNPPPEWELATLAQLGLHLGIAGVVVLGLGETIEAFHDVGAVTDAGTGYIAIANPKVYPAVDEHLYRRVPLTPEGNDI